MRALAPQAEPCLIYGTLRGRYGARRVHVLWDGHELSGRIGNRVSGKTVRVHFHDGKVSGRVGGPRAGFDVRGSLTSEEGNITSPSGIVLRPWVGGQWVSSKHLLKEWINNGF